MAINNLGKTHITNAQIQAFDNALAVINTISIAITQNLNVGERKKFKRISEKNKLLINKVTDYHNNQPALQSPDVNWPEYDLDFADRKFADTRLFMLDGVIKMLTDFKMVHDYDNYTDALRDYDYTMYKQGNSPGFDAKRADIRQFFPNTGSKKNKVPPKTVISK